MEVINNDLNKNFENLSKNDLIQIIQKTKTENQLLKGKLKKIEHLQHSLDCNCRVKDYKRGTKKLNNKDIDALFEKSTIKKIALKISYIGINYKGYARQDNTTETIESKLFDAMLQLKLIKSIDGNLLDYSRSGRTDRGVSALGNVIALKLRGPYKQGVTKFNDTITNDYSVDATSGGDDSIEVIGGDGDNGPNMINMTQEKKPKLTQIAVSFSSNNQKSLDYAKMINGCLPADIRILAFQEVHETFNARFDCLYRVYKYFFIKSNLDIELMRTAAKKFIGEHDFRNFCKLDVSNTLNYIRKILDIDIEEVDSSSYNPQPYTKENDDRMKIYAIIIKGTAFLWHQIRCMAAILFWVGRHLEDSTLIDDLFNTKKFNQRPNYELAPESNLMLYDCVYSNINLTPEYEQSYRIYNHFREIITKNTLEMILYTTIMNHLGSHKMIIGLQSNKDNKINVKLKVDDALGDDGHAPNGGDAIGDDDKVIKYYEKFYEDDMIKSQIKPSHKKVRERPLSKSYEENILGLKGKKKEIYLKKLKIKESNNEDDDNNDDME